jgi:hypothetical protein
MPTRPQTGAELRDLIAALASDDAVARESAIARLAVIGDRAVEPLLRAYASGDAKLRAGILRTFEVTAEPRALAVARDTLTTTASETHGPAADVLRELLSSHRSDAASAAFDALVATAVAVDRPTSARLAALNALRGASADVLEPLRRRLAADPDPDVRSCASDAWDASGIDDRAIWEAAVSGRLPSSPEALTRVLRMRRGVARLTELQHLVDHVRFREQREPEPARRDQWRILRGALHQALAARNSRLALYDLRDSLLESDRLPIAFLAAMEEIGDGSCLEPLAAAYEASSRSGDTWWREHVSAAFRAIVQREGLTRRHAAVKRAMARWPEAAADLMARS